MSALHVQGSRLRAYLEFVTAIVFFFLARSVAQHGANGLVGEAWEPLVEQAMLAFLLIVVYAGFGGLFDRQQHAISDQGLPLRPGFRRELGLGLAIGWGVAVACVLMLTLFGGIAVVLSLGLTSWGWLLADAAFFACATLAEEVAFRGYGFQCFVRVVGPVGATLAFSFFYALMQALLPGSDPTSIVVSFLFCIVLSVAYLRTRALWVSWGLNFGWKASRALIFGLTVSGVSSHSSVVEGNPMGPFWVTGGGFGQDGTWIAFLAFLIALVVLYRATSELNYLHNAPEFIPGGIPVDLDDAARRQHEAVMGPGTQAEKPLVQISPGGSVTPPAASGDPPAGPPPVD